MRMDLDITVHVDWDILEATAKASIFDTVSSSNQITNKMTNRLTQRHTNTNNIASKQTKE